MKTNYVKCLIGPTNNVDVTSGLDEWSHRCFRRMCVRTRENKRRVPLSVLHVHPSTVRHQQVHTSVVSTGKRNYGSEWELIVPHLGILTECLFGRWTKIISGWFRISLRGTPIPKGEHQSLYFGSFFDKKNNLVHRAHFTSQVEIRCWFLKQG